MCPHQRHVRRADSPRLVGAEYGAKRTSPEHPARILHGFCTYTARIPVQVRAVFFTPITPGWLAKVR